MNDHDTLASIIASLQEQQQFTSGLIKNFFPVEQANALGDKHQVLARRVLNEVYDASSIVGTDMVDQGEAFLVLSGLYMYGISSLLASLTAQIEGKAQDEGIEVSTFGGTDSAGIGAGLLN